MRRGYFQTSKVKMTFYFKKVTHRVKKTHEDDFSGSDDDFLGFYDEYIMVANFVM
jgi:hypothetical protein